MRMRMVRWGRHGVPALACCVCSRGGGSGRYAPVVIEVATMFPGPGESGSCVCQNLETMLMGFDQCPACEGRLKTGL